VQAKLTLGTLKMTTNVIIEQDTTIPSPQHDRLYNGCELNCSWKEYNMCQIW